MTAQFAFRCPMSADLPAIALGPWVAAQSPRRSTMAFAHRAVATSVPCWCVDVHGTLPAVHGAFDHGERDMAAAETQLDRIPRRLGAALRAVRETGAPRRTSAAALPAAEAALVADAMPLLRQRRPMAGSAASAAALPAAEAALVADAMPLLRQRRPMAGSAAPAAAMSAATDISGSASGAASVPDATAAGWRQLAARADVWLQDMQRLVAHHAWVETCRDGAVIARSAMGHGGDTQLVVASAFTPGYARVHARSMAMAVRARNAWSRLLVLLIQGSARIAAAALSPAGAIAAVPMTWRFIWRVFAEIQQVRDNASV